MNKKLIYLGILFLIIIVVKKMNSIEKKVENFQQKKGDKKGDDVIQRITGLKKTDVPYNSSENDARILRENGKFYRQQRKRLSL